MSLFPLDDLIPNICSTLSHADIVALFAVDHTTSTQLRDRTNRRHMTIIKGDCEFGITETITASVITHIAVSIYVTRPEILHDTYTFQCRGSTVDSIISISEESDGEGHLRNHLVIHTKNNIVSQFVIIILCGSLIISSFVFDKVNTHFTDCIMTCLTNDIYELTNIFTFRRDLRDKFEQTFGGFYEPSAETNAKLLRLFEAD